MFPSLRAWEHDLEIAQVDDFFFFALFHRVRLLLLSVPFGRRRTNNFCFVFSLFVSVVIACCRDHRREVNNNVAGVTVTATTTRTARRAQPTLHPVIISWVCGRLWSATAIPRLPSSSAVGSLNKAAMASCCGRSDGSLFHSIASSITMVRKNKTKLSRCCLKRGNAH